MKLFTAILLILCVYRFAFSADARSVATIQAALRSPIPSATIEQARQFDNQVMHTGMVGNVAVRVVAGDRSARVERIVNSLLKQFGPNNVVPANWTIRVLDSNPKIENAFVVGGNIIYVYTGLVQNAQTDDELAFILGHEISHSLLKHQLRRSGDLSNQLASIIEIGAALSKGTNTRNNLALLGGSIKALYSRDDEREADALGAVIAHQAGYDPSQGITFFNRMMQLEKTQNEKNNAQIAAARQTVNQQLANCEALKDQWKLQPQIRTQQNAVLVNNICNTAIANGEQFNSGIGQISKDQLKSVLMSTHPVDQERIDSLAAECDFLKGLRSLSSLATIGQGHKVLLAVTTGGFISIQSASAQTYAHSAPETISTGNSDSSSSGSSQSSQLTQNQKKMRFCNDTASSKNLLGADRKDFMKACLSQQN